MRFRFLLPLLIAPFLMGAAKKPPTAVRFHLKADPSDPFVLPLEIPGAPAPVGIKKIPEIHEGNIKAIYPVRAADGSFGCAFKLDFQGTLRLDTVSSEERGRVLVALFNTRLITAMLIDKRIKDGIIYVPSGFSAQEIELLKKRFPIMGQEKASSKRR